MPISAVVVLSPPIESRQERIILAHILRRLLVDEQCCLASFRRCLGRCSWLKPHAKYAQTVPIFTSNATPLPADTQ